MDKLDMAQWLIDHGLQIIMVVAGTVILYFRAPWLWNLVVSKLPSISLPLPGKKAAQADVISLLNQMVDSLPAITDAELHAKAVEASVAFSEAVIRQAGLSKAEVK